MFLFTTEEQVNVRYIYRQSHLIISRATLSLAHWKKQVLLAVFVLILQIEFSVQQSFYISLGTLALKCTVHVIKFWHENQLLVLVFLSNFFNRNSNLSLC